MQLEPTPPSIPASLILSHKLSLNKKKKIDRQFTSIVLPLGNIIHENTGSITKCERVKVTDVVYSCATSEINAK